MIRDRAYTEEEAYALDREGQYKVLAQRGIKSKWNWREKTLVKKILKSNPVETEETETTVTTQSPQRKKDPCPRCGKEMIYTGMTIPGMRNLKCNNCLRKISRR